MIPFTPEAVAFLKDLRDHNHKRWFEENRRIYETYLLEPFRDLAMRLAPVMSAISHRIEVRPQVGKAISHRIEVRPQVGKAISRIYRDARFSQSKLPYRHTVWLDYHNHWLSMAQTPGFFFYIEPEEWGYGMGFWQASPAAMEQIRGYLAANPTKSEKLLKALNRSGLFTLGGEKYKRSRTIDLPPATLDLYNYKTFYYIHREPINPQLFSEDLGDELAAGFNALAPLYSHVSGISGDQA